MEAKDFRIGNYLHDREGRLCKVESIVFDREEGYTIKAPAIVGGQTSLPNESIPLTDIWLIKFGFKEERNSEFVKFWELNSVTLYHEYYIHTSTGREYIVLENEGKKYQEIAYVHELQNLYYVLTGNDL